MSRARRRSSGAPRARTDARPPAFTPVAGAPGLADGAAGDLLASALAGRSLPHVVPAILDRLEAEPLASAGWFPGDLLRALLEVPAAYWARHPRHYARFRECLRAGAIARRDLPAEERAHFWTAVLPIPERESAPSGEDALEEPTTS